MIRTFIAFELKNQDTIDKIKAFCTRLKQNQPNIKLVELENVHLTMKFLGNIEESTAPKIPLAGSSGVEECLPTESVPRASIMIASTKVPPVSVDMIYSIFLTRLRLSFFVPLI